ncbi:MAG: hypothetical protein GY944_17950, partial [bacterium]|nr:hypothetical protein [bacterium]
MSWPPNISTPIAVTPRNQRVVAALAFVASLSVLLYLESLAGPYLRDGTYFQAWTSDYMLQTLPAHALHEDLAGSLWYLHKQPPGLDLMRGTLVQFLAADSDLLPSLDRTVYWILAILFALLTALLVQWLFRTAGLLVAVLAGIVWTYHPAPILYATLLEGTLISALVFTWLVFELWRLGKSQNPSGARLAVAVSLLVLTRTVFQWYFLPIMMLAVGLRARSWRVLAVFCAISFAIVGSYVAKQHAVFGITSTSTFGGYHLCGALWIYPTPDELQTAATRLAPVYPEGALQVRDPQNSKKQFLDHVTYSHVCSQKLRASPAQALRSLARSADQNLRLFLQPSSRYATNLLVDRLPWRVVYDQIFSGIVLSMLLLAAMVIWVVRHVRFNRDGLEDAVAGLGLLLPCLYAFAVIILGGNRYDWSEPNRLKFILEPVAFFFMASQLAAAVRAAAVRL